MFLQVWDDQLARVAQKWADQCADVDYKGDYKRREWWSGFGGVVGWLWRWWFDWCVRWGAVRKIHLLRR